MYYTIDTRILEMTDRAKTLHLQERRITIQSVLLVGELEQRKAWYELDMSVEAFARHIGLTPSQYWKRSQAARLIQRFPEALTIFEIGETQISHLALIAGRITEANSEVLLEGIRNKTKREVECFIARVTPDGRVLEREATFELTLKLTESQRCILDRVREVLSHGGHVPSNSEIFLAAAEDLLEKRDPMKKAERAAKRAEEKKKSDQKAEEKESLGQESCAPGKETNEISDCEAPGIAAAENIKIAPTLGKREPIPAAVRHQVWLRDKGQCTFQNPDGTACGQQMMLEIDHIHLVCRGGSNDASNLTLKCRYHNSFMARANLSGPHRTPLSVWMKKPTKASWAQFASR